MKRAYCLNLHGQEADVAGERIPFDAAGYSPPLADNSVSFLRNRAECAGWEWREVDEPTPALPEPYRSDPTDPTDPDPPVPAEPAPLSEPENELLGVPLGQPRGVYIVPPEPALVTEPVTEPEPAPPAPKERPRPVGRPRKS